MRGVILLWFKWPVSSRVKRTVLLEHSDIADHLPHRNLHLMRSLMVFYHEDFHWVRCITGGECDRVKREVLALRPKAVRVSPTDAPPLCRLSMLDCGFYRSNIETARRNSVHQPLQQCIQENNFHAVQSALCTGSVPSSSDIETAAHMGFIEVTLLLLSVFSDSLVRRQLASQALLAACESTRLQLVKTLITGGSVVTARDNSCTQDLICTVASLSHDKDVPASSITDLLQLLVDQGAPQMNTLRINGEESTALKIMAAAGRTVIVKKALHIGDLKKAIFWPGPGKSVLQTACDREQGEGGSPLLVRSLLEAGADVVETRDYYSKCNSRVRRVIASFTKQALAEKSSNKTA